MTDNALKLSFAIESYWQAGSGRGGGAVVDALAQKDPLGLPKLPGRTVKGLLRDAVFRLETWGHAPAGLTIRLFGEIGVEQGVIRLETTGGALAVSDARLPQVERDWLAGEARAQLRRGLFRYISSTAVDPEKGTARRGSLRSVEVVVPVTLEAQVEVIKPELLEAEPAWQDHLERALPLVHAVGTSRSRGLGRVEVRVVA